MKSGFGEIDIYFGDVWELATEGVVSPVHSELHPAGPIAIELIRRAGPDVERELRSQERLALGQVCVTGAGTLSFSTIIHIAASSLSRRPTVELLKECLRNALAFGFHRKMRSIAIPAVYIEPGEIPTSVAARAIVDVSAEHLNRARYPNRIVLVVPTDYVNKVFQSEIDRVHFGGPPA